MGYNPWKSDSVGLKSGAQVSVLFFKVLLSSTGNYDIQLGSRTSW